MVSVSEAGTALEAQPEFEVRGVHVSFGGVIALDCSFWTSGQTTFLIGPNGAGKSTLASVIGGAVRPDRGKIFVSGKELVGPPHVRARQGVVRTSQLPQEFGRMTTLENVMVCAPHQSGVHLSTVLFGRRNWQRQEREILDKARDILAWCDLGRMENEYARNLSGGQKKLLEFARAIMADPKLLILDEPMAGVHPTVRERLRERIREVKARGVRLLIIDHEMRNVEELSDEVVVLSMGQVLAQGSFSAVSAESKVQDAYLGR